MGSKKMTASGTVAVHMGDDLRDFIDLRARAISMTRSKYAASILAWWRENGAPAVTPADEAMQRFKSLKVAEEPAKYGKK